MTEDKFSRVELSEQEAFDILYQNDINFENIFVESSAVLKFNNSIKLNGDLFNRLRSLDQIDIDVTSFDKKNQKNWFMPNDYFPNIVEYVQTLCKTTKELDRVNEELELFKKHDMISVLKYLKFLVDRMREQKIVWGVGRGSSVSSYVLFLLGVHKIDSLKYNLDHKEFFK